MADEKVRVQSFLPPYHGYEGKVWAYLKGRPLSALVSDVFQARVEANREEIQIMLEGRARQLGISPEELRSQILKDEDAE